MSTEGLQYETNAEFSRLRVMESGAHDSAWADKQSGQAILESWGKSLEEHTILKNKMWEIGTLTCGFMNAVLTLA